MSEFYIKTASGALFPREGRAMRAGDTLVRVATEPVVEPIFKDGDVIATRTDGNRRTVQGFDYVQDEYMFFDVNLDRAYIEDEYEKVRTPGEVVRSVIAANYAHPSLLSQGVSEQVVDALRAEFPDCGL